MFLPLLIQKKKQKTSGCLVSVTGTSWHSNQLVEVKTIKSKLLGAQKSWWLIQVNAGLYNADLTVFKKVRANHSSQIVPPKGVWPKMQLSYILSYLTGAFLIFRVIHYYYDASLHLSKRKNMSSLIPNCSLCCEIICPAYPVRYHLSLHDIKNCHFLSPGYMVKHD